MANHVHARRRSTKWLIIGIALAALIAFLASYGHGYHLLSLAPLLILLACPLLHMSMHGGHGGHRGATPKNE